LVEELNILTQISMHIMLMNLMYELCCSLYFVLIIILISYVDSEECAFLLVVIISLLFQVNIDM
jgi:hypothetical protein